MKSISNHAASIEQNDRERAMLARDTAAFLRRGGKRSVWVCVRCDKREWRDELYYPKEHQ